MLAESQIVWLEANANRGTLLAQYLSLASLVDPGLLRAARIALGLPVAVELELRCSPIVSSAGPAGLVLADEVLPELRRGLDPAGRELAWGWTRARHGSISPALELEETLTWRSLDGSASSLQDADIRLKQALVTIVRDQKTQLAAWAARALPRLPESVRELSSARLLASAVEANGYRNSPSVATHGMPPEWMVSTVLPKLQSAPDGSVALNGSTLEINFSPKTGHTKLPLPEDGRVWIRWWKDGKQTQLQTTVPKSRPLFVEVDGAEIWIEAPWIGRVVLRDETAPRVEIVDHGAPQSEARLKFAEYLREHLPGFGLNVLPPRVSPGFPGPPLDFLLVVYESGRPSEFISSFLNTDRWGCRPLVVLNVEEPQAYPNSSSFSSMPAPEFYEGDVPFSGDDAGDQLSRLALATIECTDPSSWQEALQKIEDLVKAGPPPLAVLMGVPALPATFLRRQPLFDQLRLQLLSVDNGIVNLHGDRGTGRTMAAVDLVNDCSMRRRYSAGIRWARDGSSYPEDMEDPSLIVFEEPRVSDFAAILEFAEILKENGSCFLVLTSTPLASSELNIPTVDGGRWTEDQRRELFRQASSGAEEHGLGGVGRNDTLRPLIMTLPVRSVVNLGLLFGAAVRSGALRREVRDVPFSLPGLDEVLFDLDLVKPFAACPPDWIMLSPGNEVWSRYFGTSDVQQIERAHGLIAKLFPSREIPIEVSEPLAELARPTHQRIVDSYAEECGGDWAICPDDGYFLEYFARHFWHVEPDRIAEITASIDWQIRVSRYAPDWRYALPSSVQRDWATWFGPSQSLESFARATVRHTKSKSPSASELGWITVSAMSRLMASARIALRDGSRVRSIMVVGTGKYDLEDAELGVARTVGRELARRGFALITGGWQGVDYIVAEAYVEQLATNDIPAGRGLFHLVEEGRQPVFRQGTIISVNDLNWKAAGLVRADAVVAIGGAGETLSVCIMAEQTRKPVFPIPGTGGDAQTFYGGMTEADRSEVATLDRALQSSRAYLEVAQTLVELLIKKLPSPPQAAYPPPAKEDYNTVA